ncbi:hypothetical protein BDV97DRAFT_359860 [Delphinella strobiligena]|nr:hypothetical protein BDV97DRAFT_359860 [Delphinella strobiligena]
MASNEDSVESYKIAQLHELMMQDGADSPSFGALGNPTGSTAWRTELKQSLSQPAPDTQHGQHKVRHSSNTKVPRLKVAESAPLMAFVNESPSQARGDMTRAKSFHHFPAGYDAGDTQVMPSQVYKDYNRGIERASSRLQDTAESFNAFTQYTTQQDGSLAAVDLMGHWQDSAEPQLISSDEESDEERMEGGETQDLLSSINRPTFPKTPATAGRKRNHRGEPVSVASTRTPASGLSAFGDFGNTTSMSAAQMFNATQAASSPQDAPRSDPVFNRPSPNNTFRNSSPMLNSESPSMTINAVQGRATTEPRDTYLSMKESQDQRKRKMGYSTRDQVAASKTRDNQHQNQEDDEDEDEDSAQLRQARKRQHAALARKAMLTWDAVTAPERPLARKNVPSPTYGEHVPRITFRRSVSREREVIVVPDEQNSDVDPMDEYDELAQDVRQSQLNDDIDEEEQSVQEDQEEIDNLSDEEEQDEDQNYRVQASPTAQPLLPASPQLAITLAVAAEKEHNSHAGPSDFAVADSQPTRQETQQPPFPIAPSSMSSVVPGSQFPNLTLREQDVRPHTDLAVDSSSFPNPPALTSQSGGDQPQRRLHSSPPQLSSKHVDENRTVGVTNVIAAASTAPGAVLNVELQHLRKIEDTSSPLPVQQLPSSSKTSPKKPSQHQQSSAVPETDPAEEGDDPESNSMRLRHLVAPMCNTSNNTAQARETASTTYETAPTHIPASSSQQHHKHRGSQMVSESPRKAAGILRFADIATDPTLPDVLGDIDIGEVLTTEDRAFLNVMDTSALEPPTKRLKIYGKKGKRTGIQNSNAASGSTNSPKLTGPHEPSQQEANHTAAEPETNPAQSAIPMDDHQASYPEETADQAGPAEVIEPPEEQHNSAAAVKGPHVQSPLPSSPNIASVPIPPLVKKSESAGALKAAAARNALHRSTASRDEVPKSSRGKLVRPKGWHYGRSSNYRTPEAARSRRNAPEIAETPQTDLTGIPPRKHLPTNDAEMHDVVDLNTTMTAHETAVDTTHAPAMAAIEQTERQEQSNSDSSTEDFPGRVFALFRGTPQAYYPATCLGASALDAQKVRIRFDDGTVTQVEPHVLRRLDLRMGDQVKVDLPGLRNKVYSIAGFKDKIDVASAEQYPKTDIHGFAAVHLTPKDRDSLLGAPTASATANLTIPITHLYLTHTMFVKFNDRLHELPRGQPLRHQTPISELSRAPSTPGSRSRRPAMFTGGSTVRSDFSSPVVRVDGVFAGMAFAVSYSSNNAEKDHVLGLIQKNGGLVLEHGFNELFNFIEPSTDTDIPTPSKSKHRVSPAPTDDSSGTDGTEVLSLTPRAKSLDFVALIADKHSRRAKYVQALALNLPCLSGRWVLDSMAAGSAVEWPKYLLPAGESAYLYGAVRSRTLIPYDVTSAKLADTFRSRDQLLQGGRVLLVGPSQKAKWEVRKTYAFLTVALGATSVRRVMNLDAAKKILERGDESWKWVYVDGKVEDAERVLFGTGGGESGNVRGSATAKKKNEDKDKMVAGNGNVKIVGDEFVIQSLILGSLLE